jgi:hypothetical protein
MVVRANQGVYRLYFLNDDNHIESGEYFEFPSDRLVMEYAMLLMVDKTIEIWQGTRLVASLSPANAGKDAGTPKRLAGWRSGETHV